MPERTSEYYRYDQSIELANRFILAKKVVFPEDVKAYLSKCLIAEQVLAMSFDGREKERHLASARISKINLDSWELNKVGAFQELLEKIAIAKESEDQGTLIASQKCAETLIDINFYKDVDPTNLNSRTLLSTKIFHNGIERPMQELIIQTLRAAVKYNVFRFNPHLFPLENGRGEFNERRMAFELSFKNLVR